MATDATKFYGTAFNVYRAEHMNKACRYLDMACEAEEGSTKQEMAFKAALKHEAEALAI